MCKQKGGEQLRVAIYTRISTEEQAQLNQVNVLEKYANSQGWEISGTYTDVGSAFQHADQKELRRLLDECQRKHYERVLVYDVSRLTRKGPLELMLLLKRFADKGAPVHSYLDSAINVPNEFQPVLIAMYGMIAKTFSTQLSERTKAGMARAKAQGKHVGRPRKERIRVNPEDIKAQRKLESLRKKIKTLEKNIQEIGGNKSIDEASQN